MVKTLRRLFLHDTKATAAVEFALMATLMLFPLLAGTADLVEIIAGRAQLNITQQALYYFAVTNTTAANNPTDAQDIVTIIDNSAYFPVSLAAAPSLTYYCYTKAASPPVFSGPYTTNSNPCTAAQVTQTYVTYQLTMTVRMPFGFPWIGSSLTLASSGSVETN